MIIEKVHIDNLKEILELQKLAFKSEGELYNNCNIEPLKQDIDSIKKEFEEKVFLKTVIEGKIIGSIRTNIENNSCWINKLIVHPNFQNNGIGENLMIEIESMFSEVKSFKLYTGFKSEKNIAFYKKMGYVIGEKEEYRDDVHLVFMEKVI